MAPSPSIAIAGSCNKYDTIQVFRFMAALMVIILHSMFYASERLEPGFPLFNRGSNGVRLFFVISGFVMILSSESLKDKLGGWKTFALKRIIRIVPIYWILTSFKLLVLVFASTLVFHAEMDVVYVIKSYFFIPDRNIDGLLAPLLGVGWTLNFEMFFYCLFALALAMKIKAIVFVSIIFISLTLVSIFKTDSWPDIRFYTDPIVLDFLFGMIAAKLILKGKKLGNTLSLILVIIGFGYLFFPLIENNKYDVFAVGIAAFMVIYGGACIEKRYGPKMPGLFIWLGSASYSLYLIHPLIAPLPPYLLKIFHLQWPWVSVLLSVCIALVAGSAFYQLCEKPVTKYLTQRSKKRKVVLVAQSVAEQ